ncbi:MAG TPA: tetratricopeptide repeat protein, partial [Polyangiaceae bacterium]
MRFPIDCAVAAAVIGFVASSGCMMRSQRIAAPVLHPGAERAAPPTVQAEPTLVRGFDPGNVRSVLDEPALARVKAFVTAGDYANGAAALAATLAASTPIEEDAVRWRYQLGRLRWLAGDLEGAALAFDEVAVSVGPLAAYAQFGGAQALLRAGKVDEALVRARAVTDDSAVAPSARLLVAEALQLKRDFEGAIDIWRDYLSESRHPPRWIEIALRMADALLEGRPSAGQAEKAALLARRVVVEAPTSAAVGRAIDLERRALALVPELQPIRAVVGRGKNGTILPSDWAKALSFPDQLARAGVLAETQNYQDAQKALEALAVVLGPKGASTEVGCRLQLALGSVLGKQKDRERAVDAYSIAIGRCEPYPDAMVDALYFGGKASASAGRCDEAIQRFARVERDFREHRYADDARLRGADCAFELGDDKKAADMLSSM